MTSYSNLDLNAYRFGGETTGTVSTEGAPDSIEKRPSEILDRLNKLTNSLGNLVFDVSEKCKQQKYHRVHSRESFVGFQQNESSSHFQALVLKTQKTEKWELDTLFSSDQLLLSFKGYLHERQDCDSLNFCIEVKNFNETESDDERIVMGYVIYSQFLAENAPNLVNLDGDQNLKVIRKQIAKLVKVDDEAQYAEQAKNLFSREFFNPLATVLKRLITQNCLETRDFVNSLFFKEWSSQVFK